NNMAPRLVDRYLAKTGYDSQLTDTPEDPKRPDNLYKPVPGDFGAHGTFDASAHARSLELWITTHRTAIGLSALIAAGLFTLRKAWPIRSRLLTHNGNGHKN